MTPSSPSATTRQADPRIPSEVTEKIDWCIEAQRNVSFRERSEARSALVQAIADAIAQARADERRSMMAAYALSRNIVL